MPNNRAKLVYYIGAGASAKALPVAKCMPDRMKRLVAFLKVGRFDLQGRDEVLDLICRKIESLADLAASSSVDVLARRYYLQGKTDELRDLKFALSAFLLVEQARRPPDPRYGDFFAYLVDRDAGCRLAMPTDIRVISWNYDEQFERSFAEFFAESSYQIRRQVDRELQVVPSVGTERGTDRRIYDDISSIFKVNGSAGVHDNGHHLTVNPGTYVHQEQDLSPTVRFIIHFYQQVYFEDHMPYLQFAWEDDSRREWELERIGRFAPVDSVVVVGYSFPLFNRDLDRRMLDALDPQEVFVQVAQDDEAVTDRLVGLGISSDMIKVIRDLDQFYVPSTYSPKRRLSWPTRDKQEGRRGS